MSEIAWQAQRIDILEERVAELETENERLRVERDQWNADARRLSGCLLAIRGAPDNAPAEVLKGIAYDAALNCITPDVAKFQIERRTKIALEQKGNNA